MNAYVHGTLTRQWAIESGYAPSFAMQVSVHDVGVDTEFWAWGVPRGGNLKYHFAPLGASRIAKRSLTRAIGTEDREEALHQLGIALHCAQDAIAHGRLGLGHLRYDLGVALGLRVGSPDLWTDSSERKRRAIERVSREYLSRFAQAQPWILDRG